MIQRVQTVYLTFAAIATIILLFFPIAVFTDSAAHYFQLSFNGISQFVDNIWLVKHRCYLMDCIILLTLATSVISVFYFKNRKEQIKLCRLLIIFNLLILISFYYELKIVKFNFHISVTSLNWQAVLPVISTVLSFLAVSAIKKDEKLVKSMDRIR